MRFQGNIYYYVDRFMDVYECLLFYFSAADMGLFTPLLITIFIICNAIIQTELKIEFLRWVHGYS